MTQKQPVLHENVAEIRRICQTGAATLRKFGLDRAATILAMAPDEVNVTLEGKVEEFVQAQVAVERDKLEAEFRAHKIKLNQEFSRILEFEVEERGSNTASPKKAGYHRGPIDDAVDGSKNFY